MVVLGLFFLSAGESKAQRIAVSTNTLELLTLSPNMSLDISLSKHHSLFMSVSSSPWKVSSSAYNQHFTISPGYRYWLNMPYYKGYVGGKFLYSSYDLAVGDFCRKGNLVAMTVDYGYSVILSKRLNMVPAIGLGAGYNVSDKRSIVPVVTLGLNVQIVLK